MTADSDPASGGEASGVAENAGVSSKMGLDDAITAAFGDDEPSETSEKPEAEANPEGEASAEGETDAGDEPLGEQAETAKTDEEGAEPADKAELQAPQHWPQADREAFAKLPKDGQDVVLKLAKNLQAGFTRKSQELSDEAKFAKEVRGLFTDADRDQMARAGIDERRTIDHLVRLQRFATEDPVSYVKWAMQNLGVTPEALFGPQSQQPPADQQQTDQFDELLRDPAVNELKAQLAQLKSIVEGEQRSKQDAERNQYLSSVNSIQREIKTFREALDDNGNLMFPHFDTVQKHMGALMDSDPELATLPDGQDKLKRAYDMAVYARPDLRQSFIEAEVQKKIQEQQRKAEAAKAKTATAVKPAAAIVSKPSKKQTLDDIISDTLSKAAF